MSSPLLPWSDLRNAPSLYREAARHHRASGLPFSEIALYTTWKPGLRSEDCSPALVSITQYKPRLLRDALPIWRIADALGDQLVELPGAVGVLTYIQPGRRQLGSLSVWEDESAMREFIRLPCHVEIMQRFKPRGLPLRSATWWVSDFDLGPAMAHGRQLLNSTAARRVTN